MSSNNFMKNKEDVYTFPKTGNYQIRIGERILECSDGSTTHQMNHQDSTCTRCGIVVPIIHPVFNGRVIECSGMDYHFYDESGKCRRCGLRTIE